MRWIANDNGTFTMTDTLEETEIEEVFIPAGKAGTLKGQENDNEQEDD